MKTIVALMLSLGMCFTGLCIASEPDEPAPQQGQVDLDLSFRIPQKEGKGISHTPAVLFTENGRRMLTATSDGQVVVFDAGTRKVLRDFRLPEPGTDGVAIDSAGRHVVWVLAAGGLAVAEIESGEVVARDREAKAKWVAISPDGRRIALASASRVEVRELPTLKRTDLAVTADGEITNLAWCPGGKLLGWTTRSGQVVVRDPEAGDAILEAKKGAAQHAIAFAPGGDRVAYGGEDNKVYEYAFATGKEQVVSQNQPFWITCLGYSPDGGMIAVGDESCDIWLYDLKAGKLKFHNKHHVECWLNSVAWAPDNETFLFGCRPNSHAGRPHLHLPLTFAEAARADEARASRQRVLAALDAEIAKTRDEGRKTVLADYRASLVREEQVGHAGAVTATFGIGVSAGAAKLAEMEIDGAAQPPGPSLPANLPEQIRKLAQQHEETVRKEMQRLQSDFCVNQWKVR